jgi:hypothetical protein
MEREPGECTTTVTDSRSVRSVPDVVRMNDPDTTAKIPIAAIMDGISPRNKKDVVMRKTGVNESIGIETERSDDLSDS